MRALRAAGYDAASTSRSPRVPGQPEFDLHRTPTWGNLPRADACVWLFPAEPPAAVAEFARTTLHRFAAIVVLGTTSSYLTRSGEETIDEDAGVDLTQPRVMGEEILRGAGACVLRSAGIYGPAIDDHPARNPLDWLRRGLIADGRKLVNLIHVEDLAAAIVAAIVGKEDGRDFIVSDGLPRRWEEISAWGLHNGYLAPDLYRGSTGKPSRRLSNARLMRVLNPHMAHVDLWTELAILERGMIRSDGKV
jgi:hypothetical protein